MGPLLIAWSLLPGFLWLWYVYLHDRYQPEPLRRIVMVFVGGMVITIPAGIINGIGGMVFPSPGHGVVMSTLDAMLVVGPCEETMKYLVAFFLAYKTADFDEPIDGLVYSGAAALGFASAENIQYLADHGAGVIPLRAFTAVPGHFLFAGAVGYAAGLARAGLPAASLGALAVAAIMHGLYDAFLFASVELGESALALGALAVLTVAALRYRSHLKHLTSLSPFHRGSVARACDACRRVLAPSGRFCDRCGAPTAA